MFIEYYDVTTDEGVCVKAHAVDCVDCRVRLTRGGDWFFQTGGFGKDFAMAGKGWPHFGAAETSAFPRVTHKEAVKWLERQS
jgi:hypothetical protein